MKIAFDPGNMQVRIVRPDTPEGDRVLDQLGYEDFDIFVAGSRCLDLVFPSGLLAAIEAHDVQYVFEIPVLAGGTRTVSVTVSEVSFVRSAGESFAVICERLPVQSRRMLRDLMWYATTARGAGMDSPYVVTVGVFYPSVLAQTLVANMPDIDYSGMPCTFEDMPMPSEDEKVLYILAIIGAKLMKREGCVIITHREGDDGDDD